MDGGASAAVVEERERIPRCRRPFLKLSLGCRSWSVLARAGTTGRGGMNLTSSETLHGGCAAKKTRCAEGGKAPDCFTPEVAQDLFKAWWAYLCFIVSRIVI